MIQKKIITAIFLYGAMISISSSSMVDNSRVTGVYEGSCSKYYVLKATLQGAKGDRVSGHIEFYPTPVNPVGSCGAYTIDGTLSFKLFENDFLRLHSDTWLYYSGGKSIRGGTSAKGQIKYNGPFRPEPKGYSGIIEDKSNIMGMTSKAAKANGIFGCRIFRFKRISNEFPAPTLPNKEKCENGMIAIDASGSASADSSKHNIIGLKLYMTPDEVEPILEKMRAKDYTVRKIKKKTFYLRPQQSYIELIAAKKNDEDEIYINFFKPPHKNTISSIVRVKNYTKDLNKAPYFEEVINYMIKKNGKPKLRNKRNQRVNHSRYPDVLWTNYKCLPNIMPNGDLRIATRSTSNPVKNCGVYFGLTFDKITRDHDLHKGKVRSYKMILSDDSGINKNNAEVKSSSIRYAEEGERLRIEEKNRRLKSGTFSDDI